MARSHSAALLLIAAACGGAPQKVEGPPPAPSSGAVRAGGAAIFAKGEVAAYVVQNKDRKTIGRAHSTYTESDDGFRQVVTRLELDQNGQGPVQLEEAITFRRDLSPVSYKQLSSAAGRYELTFETGGIKVIREENAKNIRRAERVRTTIVPELDMMTLAIVIDSEKLAPGGSTVVDVFETDSLASAPWSMRAYADPSGKTVVDTPAGKATLDPAGRVERFEQVDRGWVLTPELPPKPAPKVRWEPPKAYRRPEGARWDDRRIVIPVQGGTLGGILSIPKDRLMWPNKLAPGVIFLSERGLQDRNGFSGNLDFGTWEMFDHLADSGFAVLRIDDRGVGASTSTIAESEHGLEIDVADAIAMLHFLEKQPEVNPRKLFVIGHGTGGVAAAVVASRVELSGVGLMATPFRRLPDLLIAEEVARSGPAATRSEPERKMRNAIAALKGSAAAEADVGQERLRQLRPIKAMLIEHAALDLKATLGKVDEPIAVFQGIKDFETSWKEDTQKIVEAAKRSAGDARVKLFAYDHVDHLMKTEPRESTRERYADSSRRLETRFLEDLTKWLSEKAK